MSVLSTHSHWHIRPATSQPPMPQHRSANLGPEFPGFRPLIASDVERASPVPPPSPAGAAATAANASEEPTSTDEPAQDQPSAKPGGREGTKLAALAAKWWEPAKDALDTLVLNSVDRVELDPYEHTDYVPFDPIIKRTEATVKNETTGEKFVVTKGAPHVLLEMSVNKDKIGKEVEEKVLELAHRGIRSLAVARTKNGDITERKFEFIGILTFLDPPRPDTKHTIDCANDFGVTVKMITGDHRAIAVETCRTLGMGTNVLGAEKLPLLTAQDLEASTTLGRGSAVRGL